MICNATNGEELNYCGETLHIGAIASTPNVFVYLKDTATGRITAVANTGTNTAVSVAMPPLSEGHTYRISLSGDIPFTPQGGTTIDFIYVKFNKQFDEEGEVIGIEDQYVRIA